ncbi:uncharacterized protein J8A68_005437 [[Candida] subhashii]|uniref:Peptide hydrolase n=1 Tax=[Candida] subhashii TaxID=561895 RepID=A0A8J5QGP0_9ASCO|nr:uncharacterized protein J8A68_005437 [[Candida] subhashii]KAG7661065.1 hypothetical protein J8A68_005437 [[Candida] subhashii]
MRVLFILSFIACLIEAFPFQFQGLRSNDLTSLLFTRDQDSLRDRLIKLGPDDYKLVSENEKLKLKREGINFIDVTNQIPIPVDFAVEEGIITKPNPPASFLQELLLMGAKQLEFLKKPVPVYKFPKEVKYNEEVSKLFKGIDTDLMLKNLGKFSSFFTRYYKSQYGVDSADWLFDEISSIIKPVNDKVNITKIRHNGWDQYSIIVSIPGKVTDKVVIGAHQDSMNLLFPNLLKAPGADDDGSGTVTTLEAQSEY